MAGPTRRVMRIAHSGHRWSQCIAFSTHVRSPQAPMPTVATPAESRSRTASAIILGADAVLAARPSTAVQLAHACLRAGYSTVVPPSWGDELLATETLRQLRRADGRAVIYCACPHVSSRLLDRGDDLAPFMLPLVAPPVAAARYLRELVRDAPVRITFLGACPAGRDPAIDEHLLPEEFLASLEERGIVLAEQPEVFDSVLPPDRRRHRSLPGGIPSAELLWSEREGRSLVELDDAEPLTELAQHLASGEPSLIDAGPALRCSCSGAVSTVSPRDARITVMSLEPPRSPTEVVDPAAMVQLVRSIGADARRGERHAAAVAEPPEPDETAASGDTPPDAQSIATTAPDLDARDAREARAPEPLPASSAFSPGAPAAGAAGAAQGRTLPRAYLARRRQSRRAAATSHHGAAGIPGGEERGGERAPAHAASRAEAEGTASSRARDETGNATRRFFAAVPVAEAKPVATASRQRLGSGASQRETQSPGQTAPSDASASADADPEPVPHEPELDSSAIDQLDEVACARPRDEDESAPPVTSSSTSPSMPSESSATADPGRPITAPPIADQSTDYPASAADHRVSSLPPAGRTTANQLAIRSVERPQYAGVLATVFELGSMAIEFVAGRLLDDVSVAGESPERGTAAGSAARSGAEDAEDAGTSQPVQERHVTTSSDPGGEATSASEVIAPVSTTREEVPVSDSTIPDSAARNRDTRPSQHRPAPAFHASPNGQ